MALVFGDSAGCLFLEEQVTGQTFDWIPHTVTSEGGGIVPDFAAEALPSAKHFLLHFEKQLLELLRLSKKNNIQTTLKEKKRAWDTLKSSSNWVKHITPEEEEKAPVVFHI